jgi:hypothetical protein
VTHAKKRNNTKQGPDWSEDEVDLAIRRYFELLKLELNHEKFCKADVYREISNKSQRTTGSVEAKFQNISSALYDLKCPYLSGLKPRPNAQKLLVDKVRSFLSTGPFQRKLKPKDILLQKLVFLWKKGWHKSVGARGTGDVGLTLEHCLKIAPNSAKDPDFMGIELKAKLDTGTLQTLFSRVPSDYIDSDRNSFFNKYAYWDPKRERKALNLSFSAKRPLRNWLLDFDSMESKIFAVNENTRVLLYRYEDLAESLSKKHNETAFISAVKENRSGTKTYRFKDMLYCKDVDFDRFVEMGMKGNIYLDFTMSEKLTGAVNDHGYLWRVPGREVRNLYASYENISIERLADC